MRRKSQPPIRIPKLPFDEIIRRVVQVPPEKKGKKRAVRKRKKTKSKI